MIVDEERDDLGRMYVEEVRDRYARNYPEIYGRMDNLDPEELRSLLEVDSVARQVYMMFRADVDSAWSEANAQQQARADQDPVQRIKKTNHRLLLSGGRRLHGPAQNLCSSHTSVTHRNG